MFLVVRKALKTAGGYNIIECQRCWKNLFVKNMLRLYSIQSDVLKAAVYTSSIGLVFQTNDGRKPLMSLSVVLNGPATSC